MKILHVNTYDKSGGAARAVYRLHQSLLKQNVNSYMLVQNKTCNDDTIIEAGGKWGKLFNKVRPHLDFLLVKHKSPKSLFSTATLPSMQFVKKINEIDPDIVHLHWVCNGMLKIEDIAKIKAPIVWTLHDSWAYTGGCHIPNDCQRYEVDCGSCSVINSNDNRDLSRTTFNRKKKTFSSISSLNLVSLSTWMAERIKNSPLFEGRDITVLPNTLDTNVYKPTPQNEARKILNLPLNVKLVLFGAMSATSDPNKGYIELKKSLSHLTSSKFEVVVFGGELISKSTENGRVTHHLGRVYDDVTLSLIYSACDVMVVPSRQEAFGQTASESIACGVPVVCFAHSGLLEIVQHKVNGYLAEPLNVNDLANGIRWVLNNDKSKQLSVNARRIAIEKFSYESVSSKIISLYKGVLSGKA